jgi:hypothetical protein
LLLVSGMAEDGAIDNPQRAALRHLLEMNAPAE